MKIILVNKEDLLFESEEERMFFLINDYAWRFKKEGIDIKDIRISMPDYLIDILFKKFGMCKGKNPKISKVKIIPAYENVVTVFHTKSYQLNDALKITI